VKSQPTYEKKRYRTMNEIEVTAGGHERLVDTVILCNDAFRTDPVITYFLNSLKGEKFDQYRLSLFRALLKASALNQGIFYEARRSGPSEIGRDGSATKSHCCRGILMPPGTKLDGVVTIFSAGVLPVMWNLGLGGVSVGVPEYYSIFESTTDTMPENFERLRSSNR
jgi:hypothetical protein